MIKSFFKIAFRNILIQKKYSIINISGLAVGIAVSLLIFLWIIDEVSYEKYNENWKNTYRVVLEVDNAGVIEKLARTPAPLAETLKEKYPEIESSSRAYVMDLEFDKNNNQIIEYGLAADEDIFEILDISLIRGEKSKALEEVYSIVISKKMCDKYFDGEIITDTVIKAGRNEYLVTGVFENIPESAHLQLDFVIPFKIFYEYGLPKAAWNNFNNPFYTYVAVNESASINDLSIKIQDVCKEYILEKETELFLQNIADIHLRSDYGGDISGNGSINHVIVFTIISILILVIASVNYMNLSVAQSLKRAREVGLRKVVGAKKSQLFLNYLGEAVVLVVVSMLLSLIVAELVLPFFNFLSGKQLLIYSFSNWYVFVLLLVISIIIGVLSGFYPASILSSYQPIKVLKGVFSSGKEGVLIRKVLVIFQFIISVSLIICFLTVNKQLSFLNNKDLGFNKDNLFYMHFSSAVRDKSKVIVEEIQKSAAINNASIDSHVISDVSHTFGNVTWDDKITPDEVSINVILTDYNFVKTMEMQIIEGVDFVKESHDSIREIIINEQAQKLMGYKNPLGKKVNLGRISAKIVGVVKDFHFKPLDKAVEPVILLKSNRESFYAYVNANNMEQAIKDAEAIWNQHCPEKPFEYHLQKETLAELYQDEQKFTAIVASFTILAILISCLGLFGLISFIVASRNKEIAIRKVLGSSVASILKKLNREFLSWVVIANIVSWPFCYFIMEKWLANYAYRINIHYEHFLIAGLISLFIAALTVTLQSVHAANKNPVTTIKYE
jgi:putative ABC transport system permease protein